MSNRRIITIIAVFLIAIVAIYAYLVLDVRIGVPESRIEADARESQNIDPEWLSVSSAQDNVCALLFYSEERERKSVFSVYVNKPGISFGYFFRAGGTGPDGDTGLMRYWAADRYVWLSLNKDKAAKVSYEFEAESFSIKLDPDIPFAFMLPKDAENITIFDEYERIIEYPILENSLE